MRNGERRAADQQNLQPREGDLFIVRPTSTWLAIWGQKGFHGNKSLAPADVFRDWQRPKVIGASNLMEAADTVMSGEVNGSRTTFDKLSTEPTWIPRYVNPQETAYLISYYHPGLVKASDTFIINRGEAAFLAEWEIVAPG